MRFIFLALLLGIFVSCNEAGFQQEAQKKKVQKKELASGDQSPSQGDPVDCTAMSETDCHKKKQDNQTPDSYRTVDCRDKSAEGCLDAIQQAKVQDGNEKSEIRVVNCGGDTASICANNGPAADCTGKAQDACKQLKVDQKTANSYRVVDCQQKTATACESDVRQALISDGNEGSEIRVTNCQDDANASCADLQTKANNRDIDLGNGSKTGTGKGIVTDGDSVTLSSIKYCAGGPINAVYAFKTLEEANDCWQRVKRPSAFNNSKSCIKCARVGQCSFKGSVDEANQQVKKLIAADCDCLTMNRASIPGISWDQAQPPCN